MKRAQYLRVIIAMCILIVSSIALSGCKAQQQMQQQVADLEAKLGESQKRMLNMDGDIKKLNFELTQLKQVVTKLGEATLELQKVDAERQRSAAEARARAESSKKKPGAKAPAKPAPKKKKH